MASFKAVAALAAALAALSFPSFSQVNQVWEQHYPWPSGLDSYPRDIAADSLDDVIVVGNCNTLSDALTIKYASDGSELWARPYDGPDGLPDGAEAVAVSSTGNVYVAGRSQGASTSWDGLILVYGPAGNLLWVRRYDGPANGEDAFTDVAVDGAGRVFVTGSSAGVGTGADLITLAYDALGNVLWERRQDGPLNGDDGAAVVELSASGGPVVAGFATGALSHGDYLTLAYDASGNLLWSRSYDGPDGLEDRASDLVVDSAGNVIVTGGSEVSSTTTPSYTTATVKYDAFGDEQWSRRLGPSTNISYPRSVGVDGTDAIYLGGGGWYSYITLKLDPRGSLMWERSSTSISPESAAWELAVDEAGHSFVVGGFFSGLPGGDQYDWMTLCYDTDGQQIWMATYDAPPGASWDFGWGIALDSAGRVLVCGTSEQVWAVPACTVIQYEVVCESSIDVYCSAKTSSLGCTPAISLDNSPSASKSWGSTLRTFNLVPKVAGLYLHSTIGPLAVPFHGGFLCVGPEVRRHPAKSTVGWGGNCTGTLTEDLNTYIASGADPALVAGAALWIQAWSRDPEDPFTDSLSDAIATSICP